MAKFEIWTLTTATIRERWTVEADTAEEAEAAFHDNHESLVHVSDETIGNEVEREVEAVYDTTEAGQ